MYKQQQEGGQGSVWEGGWLREGTHMGVSERGEEGEEREHTLHKADCDTQG